MESTQNIQEEKMENKKFSQVLIEKAGSHWENAVDHKFIREMVNGTLEDKVYANYLVQDYAFINPFTELISYAIAYAHTMKQRHELANFLSILTSEEDDYFIRSFEALGVPKAEYLAEDLEIFPSIQGFRSAIKRGIETGRDFGYETCLVIIMAAEAVYCEWATKYQDKEPEQFYYNEWLLLHNNEGFVSFVAWLKAEVDALASLDDEKKKVLEELFIEVCRLESEFFNESFLG